MNNDKCRCESKNLEEYHACEKDFIWNPVTCICQSGKYLGSIIDDGGITCQEIINAADSVSTKVSTNFMSVASINFHYKKVRDKIDCYIMHTVLLVVILLFIIALICYHYAKHWLKPKKILTH